MLFLSNGFITFKTRLNNFYEKTHRLLRVGLECFFSISQTYFRSTPCWYNTQEFKEEQFRFFENYVHFLQDNGFTTRILLKKGEKATNESQIKVGDLTPEGLKFYAFGVRKWREKYDRAKDKIRAINDFAFIEKKLKQFREQETK